MPNMPDDVQLDQDAKGETATACREESLNVYLMFGTNRLSRKASSPRLATVGRLSEAVARLGSQGGDASVGWGKVVHFPYQVPGRFTPEMRAKLQCLTARMPELQPLSFVAGERGAESCCLGKRVMISWDASNGMILTDMLSGYVDPGPFDSLAEICLVIMELDF